MANFNRVLLMGNLTRDPEMRYTQSGTAVVKFGMAVNRKYRGRDEQSHEETTFVDIEAWGRQAETINQYMSKGRPLFIEALLELLEPADLLRPVIRGRPGAEHARHRDRDRAPPQLRPLDPR